MSRFKKNYKETFLQKIVTFYKHLHQESRGFQLILGADIYEMFSK